MIQRGSIAPIVALTLAACAGGTTMRAADDNSSDEQPVALAPAPETPPESTDASPVPPTQTDQPPAVDSTGTRAYTSYGAESEIPVRRIGQWSHTGITEARRVVIRDANSWAQFWAELGVGDRPEIDFNQNLVIAVAAGRRPSGGYGVAVQRVTRATGEITVHVLETAPSPNCMTTSALTQPVDVVALPKLGITSWSFVDQKEVQGCR